MGWMNMEPPRGALVHPRGIRQVPVWGDLGRAKSAPDTIWAMYSSGTSHPRQLPHWVRLCLNVSLIVGIFAMHNVVTDGDGEFDAHHLGSQGFQAASSAKAASMSAVESTASRVGMTVQTLVASNGDMGLSMADCGGLMMLCIAMVLGITAYILLRRRTLDRLLWQLPPPLFTAHGRVIPPFQQLSPLQRSSVLRC